MKWILALCVGVAVLTLSSSPGWADVAPEPLTTGGSNLTSKEKNKGLNRWISKEVPVEMTWEEVDLYPSPEKNKVVAVFSLKNTGKKSVSFEVGFPSYFKAKLNDFQLKVDGKKKRASLKKEGAGGGGKGGKGKRTFTYWMCWKMTFRKGQEYKVEVSYWVKTGRGFKHLHEEKLPDDLKEKIWPYESGYVLRTGAGWAGKIGKATFRMHYSDEVKREYMYINDWSEDKKTPLSDKGWKYDYKTNIDTLILEDFEPDHTSDISYQFKLCDLKEEAKLLTEALKEKKLNGWAMSYLLKIIERKDNPLNLSEDEKKARVVETLEWMLPPVGPEVKQGKISRGEEGIYHRTYQRLFAYYTANYQTKKALALAGHYQSLLAFMLERDKQQKNAKHPRPRGEYQRLENEHKHVSQYITEHEGPQTVSNPAGKKK